MIKSQIMKEAIVLINSKQYKVQEGQILILDRVGEDSLVKTLFYRDNEKVLVGNPFLSNIGVKIKILENLKDKKVLVGRFKAKSRYNKLKGHRQPISKILIERINYGS